MNEQKNVWNSNWDFWTPLGGGSQFFKKCLKYTLIRVGWNILLCGSQYLQQKILPETDGTKCIQNIGYLGIKYVVLVFPPPHPFTNKEVSSCDKIVLIVTWNSFMWQEVSFCHKKFLLMPRHFFLWQEISSWDKKYLPLIRDSFLLQEISCYDN